MEQTVGDIMTKAVVTLLEEESLSQVRASLPRYRFRHLPVVDDGKVVGMLSERDMLRATVAGVDVSAAAHAREERFLERAFVRDLMQTKVVTVRASDSLKQAGKLMLEHRIGALPVVDGDNNLLGIVTENDLVRTIVAAP